MSKNQKTLFALLRAGLWGVGNPDIRIDGTTDWQNIYRLATEQSVLGLMLAGLEHSDVKPPQMLLLQWIGEVQVIEQRNKEMNVFVADLIEKLRKQDVYTLLVKGQGVAQCYEKPLWRICGDVDLFLSEDNYNKAKQVLISKASHVETENKLKKHLGLTIGTWEVEIHGSLMLGLSQRINRVLKEIQYDTFCGGNVRCWQNGNTQVFLLGAENDVIYVFVHFLSHFYRGGIGLRQVCDWCRLLWTFRDSLDYELLETRIQKMGLMTEWKAFGAFAVDYLGMPSVAMPFYSDDKKWSRKGNKICAFVIEVGNFGHNRDNSYYAKYPFLIRKIYSFGRRCGDLFRHARIFPLDSLRFFPYMMYNGLKAALNGVHNN